MSLRSLIFVLFGTGLLACTPSLNSGIHPQKVPLPIWQQTDYIFYNKTGGPVTVIFIKTGRAVRRDGTVVERPDGASQGDDGIVREFILNENGEREYIIREYDETPVELDDGECVFTISYYTLELKIREKTICDSSRHGEPDPEVPCYDKVNKVRGKKGWRNTSTRGEGSFPYVEFYNIVDKSHLFEGVEDPREFNNSCTMLVPDGYDPRSEIN